jgi:putative transposase of IS4/5 family DUF4096
VAQRRPWEVEDGLWELIEPLLPQVERRFRHPGRKRLDDRKALCGILVVPQELGYGSDMTCWWRLRDWHQAGVWQRLHAVLLARLHAVGPSTGPGPIESCPAHTNAPTAGLIQGRLDGIDDVSVLYLVLFRCAPRDLGCGNSGMWQLAPPAACPPLDPGLARWNDPSKTG